jgi:putative hydrolase of the HAD superfamily
MHLIFDFFGTLVTYREGVRGNPVTRARAALSACGVELTADALTERFTDCFATLERSAGATLREFSMHDAAGMLLEELGLAASQARLDTFIEAYLGDWTESVQALPNLSVWLAALPGSKSVLSNTHHEPMVVGLMERLHIRESFQRVTTSIGHGHRKPHPSIYRAHLEAIGADAGDVVFVGDNPECDYFGPRAVGIEAFLIAARPVSGVAERHRLAHLYQLSERLS